MPGLASLREELRLAREALGKPPASATAEAPGAPERARPEADGGAAADREPILSRATRTLTEGRRRPPYPGSPGGTSSGSPGRPPRSPARDEPARTQARSSASRAPRRPSSAGVRRPRQPASRGAAGAGRQARQARPRGGSLADDEAALAQAALRSLGAGRAELEEDAEQGGAGAASGMSARGAGSIDRDVADVEACLASLQQVRRERLSDMAACERRMELLARRSPQEAADPAQEATEAEWHLLNTARQTLLHLEGEARQILERLAVVQQTVAQEAERLRSAAASGRGGGEAAEVGLMRGVAARVRRDTGHFRETCGSVIHWVLEECGSAAEASRENMARSVAEVWKLRGRLEKQAQDVDAAIQAAEWSLAKTAKATDPRSSKTCARFERTHTLLHELRVARISLQDPLQRTMRSLQTIDACRRVSPKVPGAAASVSCRPASAGALRSRPVAEPAAASAAPAAGARGARACPALGPGAESGAGAWRSEAAAQPAAAPSRPLDPAASPAGPSARAVRQLSRPRSASRLGGAGPLPPNL